MEGKCALFLCIGYGVWRLPIERKETKKEHAKKWTEKFAEYLSIEGESAFEDEKIKAAAEHYGAEMR